MTDLLGPASSPNATTTDPGNDLVYGASDTFFKDCTSPGAKDGTKLKAAWANLLTKQMRRAIRGMGVTEDNTDPDMLLKAIQAAGNGYAKQADILAYSALYPVTALAGGLTLSTGSVVVNSSVNNYCLWRGLVGKDTTTLTVGQRTFATSANKTYHLRWTRSTGLITLRDLADASYNPSALTETAQFFDTSLDDALLAKVITNGSNVPTATVLFNSAHPLVANFLVTIGSISNSGLDNAQGSFAATLNWARSPSSVVPSPNTFAKTGSNHDQSLTVTTSNRYSIIGTAGIDGMSSGTINLLAVAQN